MIHRQQTRRGCMIRITGDGLIGYKNGIEAIKITTAQLERDPRGLNAIIESTFNKMEAMGKGGSKYGEEERRRR